MPILIILVYGEDRKLVEKPATYDNLLKVARNKFPEVEHASNNEIAFHFTPAWFNDEVELDGTSFADVHARAILRITTAASASAQHPGNDDDEIQDDSVVGPIPALSGALPPLGRMRLFVLFCRCMANPKCFSLTLHPFFASSAAAYTDFPKQIPLPKRSATT